MADQRRAALRSPPEPLVAKAEQALRSPREPARVAAGRSLAAGVALELVPYLAFPLVWVATGFVLVLESWGLGARDAFGLFVFLLTSGLYSLSGVGWIKVGLRRPGFALLIIRFAIVMVPITWSVTSGIDINIDSGPPGGDEGAAGWWIAITAIWPLVSALLLLSIVTTAAPEPGVLSHTQNRTAIVLELAPFIVSLVVGASIATAALNTEIGRGVGLTYFVIWPAVFLLISVSGAGWLYAGRPRVGCLIMFGRFALIVAAIGVGISAAYPNCDYDVEFRTEQCEDDLGMGIVFLVLSGVVLLAPIASGVLLARSVKTGLRA